MALYLRRHPFVSRDLLLMVRTLPATENGLPIQIYCFSSDKNWPSYESIQAEIMEHFVAVLPAFELYAFQRTAPATSSSTDRRFRKSRPGDDGDRSPAYGPFGKAGNLRFRPFATENGCIRKKRYISCPKPYIEITDRT